MTTSSPMCSPNRRAPTRWLALLTVGALLAPAAALAGNKEDARAHIANATRAHKEARYDDARAELEAAYRLDPQPELLYALGQVDAKLGRCDEATEYYQRFAATQRDPQVGRVVDQAIASCTSAAPAQTADHPRANPQDAPPRREPTAPRAPGGAAPQPSPGAVEVRPERWYRDKIGGALVAGGAVAAVLALVEYRGARSDLDAAGDRAATKSLDRYHELVDSAHGKRAAALVLAGAGTALITAGVIRYVLHSRTLEAELAIAPGRGGGAVTLGGRF